MVELNLGKSEEKSEEVVVESNAVKQAKAREVPPPPKGSGESGVLVEQTVTRRMPVPHSLIALRDAGEITQEVFEEREKAYFSGTLRADSGSVNVGSLATK